MTPRSYLFACACGKLRAVVSASSLQGAHNHLLGARNELAICNTCHDRPVYEVHGEAPQPTSLVEYRFYCQCGGLKWDVEASSASAALAIVTSSEPHLRFCPECGHKAIYRPLPAQRPPRDASEWARPENGHDALFCSCPECAGLKAAFNVAARLALSARHDARPLPTKRAMCLSGDLP